MPKDYLPPQQAHLATSGQPGGPMDASFDASWDGAAEESTLRRKWRRYISAVYRYKWLAALIVMAGTGAGFGMTRMIRPEYVAQVMFWVEVSDGAERAGPLRNRELLRESAWVDLLKAYTVLDYVVRQHRLYINLETPGDTLAFQSFTITDNFSPGSFVLTVSPDGNTYHLATPDGMAVESGTVGDSIGKRFGWVWAPAASYLRRGEPIAFSVVPPRDAARALTEQLKSEMAEKGNFLRLELRGGNPAQIAMVLNTIADRYVTVAADLKQRKLRELAGILEEQLLVAGKSLRDAELALEGFRVRTVTLPSGTGSPVTAGLESTRDPVFTNYFNLKIEREQLKRDREAIDRALTQAGDSALIIEALEIVPAVRNASELMTALQELTRKRGELRDLRSKFTEAHPQARQLVSHIESLEQKTIPLLATELSSELSTREAKITAMVNSASGELREIPQRSNDEARLSREVKVAEQIYTNLQARYEEARLASASSVPDVRVLDAATVPERPLTDKRRQVLFMAFMASLALALAAAIVLDHMDSRVRYPEQVTQGLGLPIMGAVPQAQRRGKARTVEQEAQFTESFRELQLNLRHATGHVTPLILAVTSPGPGDGKTFTTSNLAVRFADEGFRTLLIDADVRKGQQHKVFGVSRKPGLTDLLAGSTARELVLHQTAYKGLHMIPCGTHRQDGPKLIGSAAMTDFLDSVRSSYDVILVDSAPLGAGIDSLVLGTIAANLLLVLRTGITDRELAHAKLELLDRLPVRVLGAVLNAVPQQAVYGYYAYSAGYHAKDEELQPT